MNSIPSEIRNLKQFAVYKNNQPLKYLVGETGYCANDTPFGDVDVFTLDTIDFCMSQVKMKKADGIALYLTARNGYTVIELNNCLNDVDTAKKYSKIIEEFNSYTEISVDEKVFTIICNGRPDQEISGTISVHHHNYFVKITGNKIKDFEINEAQAVISKLIKDLQPNQPQAIHTDIEIIEKIKAGEDSESFQRLWFADWHKRYASAREAGSALVALISKHTQDQAQIERIVTESDLGNEIKGKISAIAEKELNHPKIEEPEKPVTEQELTYPPGRLGELARYIYDSSAHAVMEVSILASIMNTAGICGRNYWTRTNASLNHYLMLVAGTGIGKDEANKSRARIYKEIGKRLGIDMQFAIGPGSLGSGEGLNRYLSNNSKCFSSIFSEFWQVMSRCSKKNMTSADDSLKKAFLVYYDMGCQIVGSSAYSEEKKTIQPIHRPNVTIFGESNPKDFYASLNEGMISSGLLPRFVLLEYKGKRQYENEEAYHYKMPEDLINFMAQLTKFCYDCNKNDVIIKVEASEEAIKRLTQLGRDTTDKINAMAQDQENLKELYNRVRLKVLKLSALMAVLDCDQDRNGCFDFANPVVDIKQVEWAYSFIMRSTNDLVRKFEAGEIGSLDNDERMMQREILKTIKGYNAKHYNEVKSYGIVKHAHEKKLCGYRYICQKNISVSCFKNHRLGATIAIKQTLKNMVESEELDIAGHQELTEAGIKGQYYKLSRKSF